MNAAALAVLLAVPFAGGAWAREFHGDPVPAEVDEMYRRGLDFLLAAQLPDGNWSNSGGQTGPAIDGLAVLAILARGEDFESGPAGAAVRRGLGAILAAQDEQTGFLGPTMYHHGFATLALAEAYGMIDDPRIGPALQRAVRLILRAQGVNPAGGWRYAPGATDADTTVSGSQLMALLAARNAGIAVPEIAIRRGLDFLASCQSPDGGIGYTGPQSGNTVRTAIAVACAAIARTGRSPLAVRGAEFLAARGGADVSMGGHFYDSYYLAQALFHADMDQWQAWNARQIRRLADMQFAGGYWQERHGVTLATSFGLLSLALNYRYLPVYER